MDRRSQGIGAASAYPAPINAGERSAVGRVEAKVLAVNSSALFAASGGMPSRVVLWMSPRFGRDLPRGAGLSTVGLPYLSPGACGRYLMSHTVCLVKMVLRVPRRSQAHNADSGPEAIHPSACVPVAGRVKGNM